MNKIFFAVILAAAGIVRAADPDLTKVNFFLWTRNNPVNHDILQLNEGSIHNSHFNPDHPILVLSHGWNSHGREGVRGFGQDFAPHYFEVGDYNIISVDWGDIISWTNYPAAADTTRPVGEHLADLITIIVQHYDVFDNIHLVGHSLGAHVVGFCAKKLQETGVGKIKKITGLDPAFPFFELAGVHGRLDKSDAEFVQIVHTNSGWLWEGCLSFEQAIGHVDFYPAGGKHQPGCTDVCIIDCYDMDVIDLLKGGCSHSRAVYYMAESVRSMVGGDQFLGRQCDSWEEWEAGACCDNPTAVMGEWVDVATGHGKYYFMVNEEAPYAQDVTGIGC